MPVLFLIAGLFTLALGIVHFFMPGLFDFESAIPREGPPLKPFRLFFYSHRTRRSDVRGIAMVMNHTVSFVLVSIGVADLFVLSRVADPIRKWLLLWIAAWWLLRAACQFYLGRRKGDWLVLGWFALLGVLHIVEVAGL